MLTETADTSETALSKIKATNALPGKPLRRWLRPALVAIPIAAILIALFVMQPWQNPFSPQTVLARANEAISELQSYRMMYSSEEVEDSTVLFTYAQAAYAAPDRFRLTLFMRDWTREYIHIGESLYERETGAPVHTRTQVIFFSSYVPHKEAALHQLEQLIDVEALPDEEIDGVVCYRLRGRYDAPDLEEMMADLKDQLTDEEFQQLVEQFDRDNNVTTVEFWISKDDYLIRKMQYETKNQEGEVLFTETMIYFGFNQTVTIEPPLDDEGNFLPGWYTIDVNAKKDVSRGVPYPSAIPPDSPPVE